LCRTPHFSKTGKRHPSKKISFDVSEIEIGLNDPSGNPDDISTAPTFFNVGRAVSKESTWTCAGTSVEGDFDRGTAWSAIDTPRSLSKSEYAASANSRPSSGYDRAHSAYFRPELRVETVDSALSGLDGGSDWTVRSVSRLSSYSAHRYTSRAGSEAHHLEHERRLESDLEAAAQDLHDSLDPQGQQHVVSEVAQWDKLSLRQWFNKIDSDNTGSVSKQEWCNFVREHPKFRQMLLNLTGERVADRLSAASLQRGCAEAREMKKVMKILKDLDVDNSGTLEFEEFLELFRRTGHLIEYKDEANPREEMAAILGDIHDNTEAVGNSTVHQLVSLAKHNLAGRQSRTIELDFLQLAPVQKLTTQRVNGQSLPPLHKVTSPRRDKAQ